MPRATPTALQQAYLAVIRDYFVVHREAPAEADLQRFFAVSPPAVHRMVVALAEKGFISRVPGQARSIRLVDMAQRDDHDEAPPASKPPGNITEPLDPDIAPVVEALRADPRVVTKASCSGHGKQPAYVDLAVDGLEGLRMFVERLNRVDRRVTREALLDVRLNWSHEVVTACAFDVFPTWIMLSLRVEVSGRKGAPSAKLLAKIATLYARG